MSLSLILPTVNECENLRVLIPELLAQVPQIRELLVVDDGSTDGTRELVRAFAAQEPRVRLLAREGTPGLTAALQDGIRATSCELLGWMDADLAMSPADLGRLLLAVETGADVAVGSRFAPGGGVKGQQRTGFRGRLAALKHVQNSEDSWVGVALSWTLNVVLIPALVGGGVHDYTSGFVVMRRAAAQGLQLRGDHGEYFITMMAHFKRRGIKVMDVPYQIRARQHGRSKTANSFADWGRRGVHYLMAAAGARFQR